MIVALAFWSMLLCAAAIGWQAGDHGDRKVIGYIVGTAATTATAQTFLPHPYENAAISVINLALLWIVWRYAMVSRRYWPLWFAGFQAVACLLSFVGVFAPAGMASSLFAAAAAFWSIPAIVVMAGGILLDRRAKRRAS